MSKSMKASCKSPANIAFIKYWGKADYKTRVPQNNSISMCLSNMYSVCTIKFDQKLKKDNIKFLNEKVVLDKELQRMVDVLDRVRKIANVQYRARVVTKNNFPKATGIASSASGLSAVTVAACKALGLNLDKIELSKLARFASGTASRSIPDGFAEWLAGTSEKDSYSVQIFSPKHWQISDVVAIVSNKMKKISSTKGHKLASTSPFQKIRISNMHKKIKQIKQAMKAKDFTSFGKIIEKEALSMHSICLTSKPSVIYWEPITIKIMKKIQEWRAKGLESYFTIDAGPTVHVICQSKDEKKIFQRLKTIVGVDRVVINHSAVGAKTINNHLF